MTRRPDVSLGWRLLPLLPLVACLLSVALSPPRIGHDSALYLQCAELLLEGRRLYVDFIDLNPPLIVYVSAIPLLAARLLGADAARVENVLVLALAAWSALSLRAKIERGADARWRPWAAVVAASWLLFCSRAWAHGEIGQRDFLSTLLLAPFVAARWRRWQGALLPGREAVVAGLASGLALCLKPQLGAVVLAVEVYFGLVHRDRRALRQPEVWSLLAVCVAYGVHFALLPPAPRAAYLGRWLPLLARGYAAYDSPLSSIVGARTVAVSLAALAVLAVRGVWLGPRSDLTAAFAVACLAAVAAYLLQHKGWRYQLLPAQGFAALMGGSLASASLEGTLRFVPQRRRSSAEAAACFAAWAASAAALWALGPLFPAPAGPVSPLRPWIERYTEPREDVLVLSTNVGDAYPVIFETGRRPGSRYLWLFPLPMLYHDAPPVPLYRDAASAPPEERQLLADLAADLEQRRPPLLFVHAYGPCQGCRPGFNVMDYLSRDAGVAGALRRYRRLGEVGALAVLVAPERTGR